MFLMMALLLTCSSGCSLKQVNEEDPLRFLYDQSSFVTSSKTGSVHIDTPSLTLSAHAMPFSVFSRVLSDRFLVGLVFSEKLFEKTITSEFKNTSLQDVLNVVSRQLDADVVKVGNTYYIGQLRSQDRGILVRRIVGFTNPDLQKAVDSCLSDKGKGSVIGSGIISVIDHESVLTRVSELLDYLDHLDQPVWILQLAFLSIQRDALLEAGVKVSSSGSVSYNLSENTLSFRDLKLDGIINAAMSSSYADVHTSPMLFVREGSLSSWKHGQRIPIPKKTTSSYGVVTTEGFEYVEVGFSVTGSISSSRVGGLLDLRIEKSDIDSYVESAPLISQNVYQFRADLMPGKPYLLGELQIFKDLNSQTDILNLGKKSGRSVLQLWGQIYRISPGSLKQKYPLEQKK